MPPVVLIALVVLVTSAVACNIGVRWLGLNYLTLARAGLAMIETLGMGAVFFGTNLAIGMIVIAVVHALTGHFVSHYILSDVSLLSLSLVQGLVFACWRRACEQPARSRSEPVH